MTEKLNIVQSTTEPDKRNIWLKDNELKKFGAKGWSTIGGKGGDGGGTSTDDFILYFDFKVSPPNFIVDDKIYTPITADGIYKINSKELYNILYNFISSNNKAIVIKATPNSGYLFAHATYFIDNDNPNQIFISAIMDPMIGIIIYNQ